MSSFPYHSEFERRVLRGDPYRGADDNFLRALYLRARDLCFRLNALHPAKREEQRHLLKELLDSLREGTEIAMPLFLDFGKHTRIGCNCRINTGLVVGAGAVVRHDIPPRMLAVGSPAREIRKIQVESSP